MLFRVLSTITLLFAFSLATAAASPSLGDDLIRFDLDKKLDIEVQFDRSNPKSGHIEFERDNNGNWNLELDPAKYHGPNKVDADYLFVDRDSPLDSSMLKFLRKGWLPLVRALPVGDGETFVYEFATPVEISQFVWPDLLDDDADDDEDGGQYARNDDDDDDDDDEDDGGSSGSNRGQNDYGDYQLTFFSDIAGTMQIAPTVNQTVDQGQRTAFTLVVPQVRRIVLSAAAQTVVADNSGGGSSGQTPVNEPASALLLLPGLAALYAVRRRRRQGAGSTADS